MGERKPYNEPCKICGSTNQVLMIAEGRRSIYCRNCSNFEDIYVSKELQQQWDNEAKNQGNQQTTKEPKSSKLTVECPYCHSTDTKKITNTSKAVHTAVFGIFSIGRNSKNFHCNKCGSDF